jgi:hypothetical protein
MNKIREQQQQTKHNNLIVLSLGIIGVTCILASYVGTKYATTTTCFNPKAINRENRAHYCQDSQRYDVLSSFLEYNNYRSGNPQFKREYRALLPKITRLEVHEPTNPNAALQSFVGTVAITLATIMYCARTKQTLETFPVYFEEYKNSAYDLWNESKQERDISAHRTAVETSYLMDGITKQDSQQRASEMSQSECEDIINQADRQQSIESLQFDLMVAEIKEQIAKKNAEEAKQRAEEFKSKGVIPQVQQSTDTKLDLEKKLKNHEGGWLWDMAVGTMPVILYGKAGSYKSYSAACIALIKFCFQKDAKLVSICDPHAHQNRDESWRHLIELEPEMYGSNENWEGYAEGIGEAFTRWGTRTLKDSPLISIWDELTTMGQNLPGLAPQLMPKMVSAPRKANENVILITHALTNNGLGGVEGMSESIKDGCLQLKLKGSAQQKPIFKGNLNGWVDANGDEIEDYPITLPDWFRPEQLITICK